MASSPGAAVSVYDLLESGWPGENVSPEAGAHRVYVAISRLRQLGLGDVLARTDEGYSLQPDLDVRVA